MSNLTENEIYLVKNYAKASNLKRGELFRKNKKLFALAYKKIRSKKTMSAEEYAFLRNIALSNVKQRIVDNDIRTLDGEIIVKDADSFYLKCKKKQIKKSNYNFSKNIQELMDYALALEEKVDSLPIVAKPDVPQKINTKKDSESKNKEFYEKANEIVEAINKNKKQYVRLAKPGPNGNIYYHLSSFDDLYTLDSIDEDRNYKKQSDFVKKIVELFKDGAVEIYRNNVFSVQDYLPSKKKEKPQKINTYEEKQRAKRERYEELARKAHQKSLDELKAEEKKGISFISFGDPTFLGYSHQKDGLTYRDVVGKNFPKSYVEYKKAKYYEEKAKSVGKAKISSDVSQKLDAKKDFEKALSEPKINAYEEKQRAKRERYEELAQKAAKKSEELDLEAKKMASVVPFGQPILVGHHSERGDRAYRKRFAKKFDKSYEEYKKAKYYENKAKSVGKAGISSDDPEAIRKLKEKLARAKDNHQLMLDFNKAVRKKLTQDEINKLFNPLGLDKKQVAELLAPDYMGRTGYAPFNLSNSSQNIRTIEQRIKFLEANKGSEKRENYVFDGGEIIYNTDENRVQILFDEIPSAEFRTILKQKGFRGLRGNKIWQRFLNSLSWEIAKQVVDIFLESQKQ